MRTIEVTLYKYDELPTAKAKAKAIDWMREGEQQMWQAEFEFAETAARKLGIVFATREIPLMSGKTRTISDIRYSGFYSQGDGLSFVGTYQYEPDSLFKIMSEFPTEDRLIGIARDLASLQAGHANSIAATITQAGHYTHKYTMDVDLHDSESYAFETELEEQIEKLMRDFADWIYEGIREDYEYRLEDEQLIETLMANEYEFHEDGRRA